MKKLLVIFALLTITSVMCQGANIELDPEDGQLTVKEDQLRKTLRVFGCDEPEEWKEHKHAHQPDHRIKHLKHLVTKCLKPSGFLHFVRGFFRGLVNVLGYIVMSIILFKMLKVWNLIKWFRFTFLPYEGF